MRRFGYEQPCCSRKSGTRMASQTAHMSWLSHYVYSNSSKKFTSDEAIKPELRRAR